MTNKVCLISVTPDAEKTMGYIARVSNPKNQDNPNVAGLLSYCIKHQHWSVFEQAHLTLEINTTRAMAAQILRHRSFTFQEFSQRYAAVEKEIPVPDLRRQDDKNRQNSIDDVPQEEKNFLQGRIAQYFNEGVDLYNELLSMGYEVILDDRKDGYGVKMKDAELIGIPINIIIGKKYLQNDEIELIHRNGQSSIGKIEDITTIFEHYKSS